MTDYVKITDFATKDTLTPGDPLKKVRGVEINAEFVAIQAAVGSKLDKANPAMTGSPTAPNPTIDSATTQLATTRWVRDLINVIEPLGTVKAFVGSPINIPAGWALCNGASGTVNLTDRFIAGFGGGVFGQNATAGHTAGVTVLPVSGTTSNVASHNHGAGTAGHALTVFEIPAHTHASASNAFLLQDSASVTGLATDPSGLKYVANNVSASAGGGETHAHGISNDGAHSHVMDGINTTAPVPGFFSLAFIQKIALL